MMTSVEFILMYNLVMYRDPTYYCLPTHILKNK